tara:strand:+ start:25268 stop:25600 length:333 start_codon:yes stop_codon:yes gene_type:complete
MEGTPKAKLEQKENALYVDGIAPVLERVARLSKLSPEAYELWGGDAERWHLERRSLVEAPEEREALENARQSLDAIIAISSGAHSHDWLQRIEQEADRYHFALYGVRPTE